MKINEWARVCGQITRLWPNDPIKPDTAEAWFPLVADLELADVSAAVAELRLQPDVRWAPTPGQIRDACTPQHGSWTDGLAELQRRLARSDIYAPDGTADAVTEFMRSLGPIRRGDGRNVYDVANPTCRAQFRDWWHDWHRRTARQTRRQIATAALDTPAGNQRQLEGTR